jgi:hypothetical protein
VDYYVYGLVKPEGGEPSAASTADGRFVLVAPRDDLEKFARGDLRFAPRLIASAPGFGPGFAEVANLSGVVRDVTVRLVRDDHPIEGRVLDLEGRPVAGAEVETSTLFDPPDGDLSRFIKEMTANPTGPHEAGLREAPFKVRRTTGPDGRFRLDGVGRERVVMFTVSGRTIAITRTFAMTKDVPPLRSSNTHTVGPRTMVFHGARFDFVAAPCKPVAGTVRDLDTGKPIAGVRVNGMVYDDHNLAYYHEVASTTDDQGRYRLLGMAPAGKYRLFLFPGEGLPYCNASFVEAVDAPGLDPATVDLTLKRGVLVRGRVTDKATGKPVQGAIVRSFAMRDNPHVPKYPGFRECVYETHVYTDGSGRFTIAALPGQGMLGVRATSERYLMGVGAEAIRGKDPNASLPALPGFPFANNYNVVARFDAESGTDPVSLDLQLDPGRSVSVTVVDPDGKPVPGCRVFGLRSMPYWDRRPLDLTTFEVTGLDPREPRHLMFFHEGRKLGGSLLIGKDVKGPFTVTLRPCGVITGRLVDEDGRPRTRLALVNYGTPNREPNRGIFHDRCAVDGEGRFQVEVIPGLSYTATAEANGLGVGQVFEKVTLGPAEVRDLGDITVKARAQE